MMIDTELKKRMIEDWQNAFPQLGLYGQDKLYKVVGPIIIGLEMIKLPRTHEYRPHFVTYPLWKKDVNASLAYPFILTEYYNKKGLQYSIAYEEHRVFFNEVLDSVKKETPLSFDGNISFGEIASVIDEYSRKRPLSATPNSYMQALLQEAKLKIALYVNIENAQNVLAQINKRNWDTDHFRACGVSVDGWLQELQEIMTNRDEFLRQIEINRLNKKVIKLENSDIVM